MLLIAGAVFDVLRPDAVVEVVLVEAGVTAAVVVAVDADEESELGATDGPRSRSPSKLIDFRSLGCELTQLPTEMERCMLLPLPSNVSIELTLLNRSDVE